MDTYSNCDEYRNFVELYDETKDYDTGCLSSDSGSSADLNTEREYLIVKVYSEEESDNDNIVTQSIKSGKYMNKVESVIKHDDKRQDPFTCSNCYKNFKTIGELENHDELEHNIKLTDKINCAVCNEVVSKSFYKVHIKLHREKYIMNKKRSPKIECKICKKLVNKTYFNNHMKLHGSEDEKAEIMRGCTICKKSFSLNYYNNHMQRIHKLGPNGEKQKKEVDKRKLKHLQCPVCDKKVLEEKYKIHVAQHGKSPKKYVCEHCAKVFIYPSGFKVHCLSHKGEFKYKCQFCPYSAQYIALLKIHVRTHTGDYNYKCSLCPAKFITKSNLNQHMRRHEGPGNIKCYDCDKLFYRSHNMEEHYKNAHLRRKDVICNMCGKGFCHRDRMLSHQIKVHKRDKLLLRRVPSYLKFKPECGNLLDVKSYTN